VHGAGDGDEEEGGGQREADVRHRTGEQAAHRAPLEAAPAAAPPLAAALPIARTHARKHSLSRSRTHAHTHALVARTHTAGRSRRSRRYGTSCKTIRAHAAPRPALPHRSPLARSALAAPAGRAAARMCGAALGGKDKTSLTQCKNRLAVLDEQHKNLQWEHEARMPAPQPVRHGRLSGAAAVRFSGA
jgi:hypothetical protein